MTECCKKNSPTDDKNDPTAIFTLRNFSCRFACSTGKRAGRGDTEKQTEDKAKELPQQLKASRLQQVQLPKIKTVQKAFR